MQGQFIFLSSDLRINDEKEISLGMSFNLTTGKWIESLKFELGKNWVWLQKGVGTPNPEIATASVLNLSRTDYDPFSGFLCCYKLHALGIGEPQGNVWRKRGCKKSMCIPTTKLGGLQSWGYKDLAFTYQEFSGGIGGVNPTREKGASRKIHHSQEGPRYSW